MRTSLAVFFLATTLVAQSNPGPDQPILAGVLDSSAAAQFVLPVRGFSATQLAFSPVPHPTLRVGATNLPVPDPLLCSASYAGADLEQLVFAVPQGGIVLLDASPSLAFYSLIVPAGKLATPTGICIDRKHDQVVLLDAAQPSFLRIDLADLRAGTVRFQTTSLPPAWSAVRGIAFDGARDRIVGLDPTTGELLQLSANNTTTSAGELRRLAAVGAFGFAPTLNLSQPSIDLDLFVTWGDERMLTDEWTWNYGATDDETGTLIASVDTSVWVPPSPDPSGITWDAAHNRLVISDSEVDEMPIYAGKNLFETSTAGVVARSTNTLGYSGEPTGMTLDAATGTFYISDDDRDQIWVITLGPDGLLNTADDTRRTFRVNTFCPDAESIAFDNGTLWIADGAASVVHRLRPGANGIFDGIPPAGDDVLYSFDVSQYGVTDPSGVAVRSGDGGVHVLGIPKTRLIHLNKVGQLVRVINLPGTSMIRPQGLVFAPSTVSAGDSLFLVDRGHDNDAQPTENDGKFREYGMPAPAQINMPPVVNAGPDFTMSVSGSGQLAGFAEDDGLPSATLTRQWSKLSGPGTATFTAPTQAVTNVSFSTAGTYTLQLSASDGTLTATDTCVVEAAPGTILERFVAASWDDAEEQPTAVVRSSTDLEMVVDGTINQVVGLRFLNLTIPPGATIAQAYVQFTVDAVTSVATQLTIAGEANDNPPTFLTNIGNISTRPRTTATVNWTPVAWSLLGEAGLNQRTPELATVLQQIVSRPGWVSGNALVLVITGTGCRNASSWDRSTTLAPKLFVRYVTGTVNQPPIVNAGPDVSHTISSATHLAGSVIDDGLPGPATILWTKVSGPGTVTFAPANVDDTNATFSLQGSYTLQLSANDGQYTRTDTCVVTVTAPANQPPVVNAGPDVSTALATPAHLAGTVADDGLPGPVTIAWTKVTGPGTATFTAPAAAVTDVSFSLIGNYTLQLSANDGQFTVTDTVAVTVTSVPTGGTVDRTIAAGGDDAEEQTNSVNLTGSDIELGVDGSNVQTVGLRFTNLTIPPGATISSAFIQFAADEVWSVPTNLTFAGEANDNSAAFTSAALNVSGRPRTTATVAWAPVPWTVVNEVGPNEKTPDLKTIVQQVVSRPGWVSGNAMAFVVTGTGTRTAVAFESNPTLAAKLTVNYSSGAPVNQPPVVNAGPDVSHAITSATHLSGTVTDDGLPGPVTIAWTKVTGPGTATFAPANTAGTDVTFSLVGSYTLQLSANDGQYTVNDTVVVTVTSAPVNQPPVVNAGPDINASLATPAHIVGSVTDDGLPGPVTIAWTKLTGPGTATFAPASAAVTDVTFSLAGSYTLQLSANDGQFTVNDTVAVTVTSGSGSTVERTIAAGGDDAEEQTSSVNLTGSDIELGVDGSNVQVVGLRFTNLTIPPGSTISSAFIQFAADEVWSVATNLTFAGEANDNSAAFTSAALNVSGRPRTTATVAWAPVPWTVVNEVGPNEKTPDLKSIVQQVVNRPGWASGNAMAFVVTGTGTRTAVSFESNPTLAAKLIVNYSSGPPVNQPPVVNAGPDLSHAITSATHIAGSVTDDGLSGPVTIAWTRVSGPGTATFTPANAAVTDVTFSVVGSYTLQLSANDGQYTVNDTVVVTVTLTPTGTVERTIAASGDDAEEQTSSVSLTGSDIELGVDGSNSQTVGLRFTNLTIPPGATISSAFIQFAADEVKIDPTSLTFAGEASDNSAAFTSAALNVSSRPRTTGNSRLGSRGLERHQ
jgi:hypothetical protein